MSQFLRVSSRLSSLVCFSISCASRWWCATWLCRRGLNILGDGYLMLTCIEWPLTHLGGVWRWIGCVLRHFEQAFSRQRHLAGSLGNSGNGDVFRWRDVNLYIHVYIRFFVCGTLTRIGKAQEGSTDPMMSLVGDCSGLMMCRGYSESSRVGLDWSSMNSYRLDFGLSSAGLFCDPSARENYCGGEPDILEHAIAIAGSKLSSYMTFSGDENSIIHVPFLRCYPSHSCY